MRRYGPIEWIEWPNLLSSAFHNLLGNRLNSWVDFNCSLCQPAVVLELSPGISVISSTSFSDVLIVEGGLIL